MDFTRFSKVKAFLGLLAFGILALSISTVGLSAHGIAFYMNSTTNGLPHYVKVHGYLFNSTGQNATQFTTLLSYEPVNGLDMSDMYALLISGILGTLLGSVNLLANFWSTECTVNLSLTGRTVRPVDLLGSTVSLLVDACMLLTFVSVAGYSWTQTTHSPWFLDETYIAQPHHRFAWYNSTEAFTFERWNRALADFATGDATNPTRRDLYGMWKQARTARELVLVLFLLAITRLAMHFWSWRRHNIAVRLGQRNGYREMDVRAKSEAAQGSWSDSMQEGTHTRDTRVGDIVELPAHRLSRTEAPDTGVGEMPGEDASKELQAEIVARELDASRRSNDKP